MTKGKKRLRLSGVVATSIIVAFCALVAPRIVAASGTENVAGWAWSEQVGWISMNGTNCERFGTNDPCNLGGTYADPSYGVHTDALGFLSGFAWSRSVQWICFGATCDGYGGQTPPGGWTARFNAITGQATGWAKVLGLGDDGWIALSCDQATPSSPGGTCASGISYFTTWQELDVPNGEWSGYAWNGPAAVGGHALGWISWRPQNYGGVVTTWNPQPVCTVSGEACTAHEECSVLGELCCRGGAPCGQCRGFQDSCDTHAACASGDLCCPAGVPCGRCVTDSTMCGGDDECTLRDGVTAAGEDSCCPPGAICTRYEDPDGPETVGTLPGAIGFCSSGGTLDVPHTACLDEAQCAPACTLEPPQGLCEGEESIACTEDVQCTGGVCNFAVGLCDANATSGGGATYTVPCLGGIASNFCATHGSIGDASALCRNIIGICADDAPQRLCVADANCTSGRCEKIYLPWLQTQYGPLFSGGSIGNPQTAPPPVGEFNATYCILSGGPIVNFLSEEGCADVAQTPYNLSPSSTARIDVPGILAGRYGDVVGPPNGDTSSPWTNANFLLNRQVFLVDFTTNPTPDLAYRIGAAGVGFINGIGEQSGAGLIVIRGGDLHIDGDITYVDSGPLFAVHHLASPGWLVLADENGVGGNIVIDPSVAELVGAFYAQGAIETGTTGAPESEVSLRVNGVMIAREFAFSRQRASYIIAPAEQVVADGRVLVNTPPGFGDVAQSLPQIRQIAPLGAP
ncbi:MAG: hypothetical protein Q7S96_01120 [bacterium]|nr:hypothetical protein [bacterium]